MFDSVQLLTLTTILRHGSLEGAAAEMGVTPSAISQRLKKLEDRAGRALITRTTPCRVTEAGRAVVQHAEDVGLMEARLWRELRKREHGIRRLRIAAGSDSASSWLPAALGLAAIRLWDLAFEVVPDDAGQSAEWLREGSIAAAVSERADPPTGCYSLPLGPMVYLPVLDRTCRTRHFRTGVSGALLREAPLLRFAPRDRLVADWMMRSFGVDRVQRVHDLPSPAAVVKAGVEGLGWSLSPRPLIRAELAERRLLPLVGPRYPTVPLYWHAPKRLRAELSQLQASIASAARTQLR